MFCADGQQAVAFVGEVPKIASIGGGLLCITFKSGERSRQMVFPLWLVRLIHERVAKALAEQDAGELVAH